MWLLLIPAQIVINIILISLAAYGDTAMANPEALGHPAPALSILAFIMAVIITAAVIILSIILVTVRFSILKKRRKGEGK